MSEGNNQDSGETVGFTTRIKNRIRRLQNRLRSSPRFHRSLLALQRIGHGSGRNIYIIGVAVLLPVWLIGSFLAMQAHLEQTEGSHHEQSTLENIGDSAYWAFLTFGGSDTLARSIAEADNPETISSSLTAARWLGLIMPLWLGLPPLFSWLIRVSERGNARHALADHYVLLGYGRVGQALAHDLLSSARDEQRAVVIVDNSSQTAQHHAIRRAGAIVLEYDAQDPAVLADVSGQRARGILVATGSSSRNIDISGHLAASIEETNRYQHESKLHHHPKIVPHIAERHLMEWVASDAGNRWRSGTKKDAQLFRPQIWPFSAEQTAARHILTEHPIAEYARLRDAERPHIVLLGLDSVGEWLLPMLFQMANTRGLAGPRVTLILDSSGGEGDVERKREWIERRYPFLSTQDPVLSPLREHLDIHFTIESYNFDHVDSDLFDLASPLSDSITEVDRILSGDTPPPEKVDVWVKELDLRNPGDPVTSIFLCFGDDDRNLELTLQLQDLIDRNRRWLAPTFVRLRHDSGLEEVLNRSSSVTRLSDVIDDFGQDEKTCTHAEIFDSCQEAAAQEAHNAYLISSKLEKLAASDQGEKLLSKAADEFVWKLLEVSKVRTPGSQNEVDDELAPQELQAAVERLAGDQLKENTYSKVADVAWNALHFEYVNSNRDQVDHLPVKLRGLGYRPRRRDDSIDVTGSRIMGPWPIPDWKHGHALTFREAWYSQKDTVSKYRLPPIIDETATLEHERWMTERLLGGWQPGAERDNARKKHPSLRQNIEKAADEVRKDQRTILNMHDILAKNHAPVDWHPECTIAVLEIGATLDDRDEIQDILGKIVERQAKVLAGQYKSLWDEKEMDLEGAKESLAITLLTDSVETARQWMTPGEHVSNPFRAIIPKTLPNRDKQTLDYERADSWEVDILPEGIPTTPLDNDYKLKWKVNSGGELSTDKADDGDNASLKEVREKLWENHLAMREVEFMASRAEWVVMVYGSSSKEVEEYKAVRQRWLEAQHSFIKEKKAEQTIEILKLG